MNRRDFWVASIAAVGGVAAGSFFSRRRPESDQPSVASVKSYRMFETMDWPAHSPDNNAAVRLCGGGLSIESSRVVPVESIVAGAKSWFSKVYEYYDDKGRTRTLIVIDELLDPIFVIIWNTDLNTAWIFDSLNLVVKYPKVDAAGAYMAAEDIVIVHPCDGLYGELTDDAVKLLSSVPVTISEED
jgi:hypothetical protein